MNINLMIIKKITMANLFMMMQNIKRCGRNNCVCFAEIIRKCSDIKSDRDLFREIQIYKDCYAGSLVFENKSIKPPPVCRLSEYGYTSYTSTGTKKSTTKKAPITF